ESYLATRGRPANTAVVELATTPLPDPRLAQMLDEARVERLGERQRGAGRGHPVDELDRIDADQRHVDRDAGARLVRCSGCDAPRERDAGCERPHCTDPHEGRQDQGRESGCVALHAARRSATPCAPWSIAAGRSATVRPPSANTGSVAPAIRCANPSRPIGTASGCVGVARTGPSIAKSRASAPAFATSSRVWQEAATR